MYIYASSETDMETNIDHLDSCQFKIIKFRVNTKYWAQL